MAEGLPLDVKPQWLNVVRRLQSVARDAREPGYALISITVLVDGEGFPVFWSDPAVTRFNPYRKAAEFLHQFVCGMVGKK